jgi:hypothetical protein
VMQVGHWQAVGWPAATTTAAAGWEMFVVPSYSLLLLFLPK